MRESGSSSSVSGSGSKMAARISGLERLGGPVYRAGDASAVHLSGAAKDRVPELESEDFRKRSNAAGD